MGLIFSKILVEDLRVIISIHLKVLVEKLTFHLFIVLSLIISYGVFDVARVLKYCTTDVVLDMTVIIFSTFFIQLYLASRIVDCRNMLKIPMPIRDFKNQLYLSFSNIMLASVLVCPVLLSIFPLLPNLSLYFLVLLSSFCSINTMLSFLLSIISTFFIIEYVAKRFTFMIFIIIAFTPQIIRICSSLLKGLPSTKLIGVLSYNMVLVLSLIPLLVISSALVDPSRVKGIYPGAGVTILSRISPYDIYPPITLTATLSLLPLFLNWILRYLDSCLWYIRFRVSIPYRYFFKSIIISLVVGLLTPCLITMILSSLEIIKVDDYLLLPTIGYVVGILTLSRMEVASEFMLPFVLYCLLSQALLRILRSGGLNTPLLSVILISASILLFDLSLKLRILVERLMSGGRIV